jgi:hypothetical protein
METEVLDYSLFGEILVNPATGETATPTEALKGKVVSGRCNYNIFMHCILLYCTGGAVPFTK